MDSSFINDPWSENGCRVSSFISHNNRPQSHILAATFSCTVVYVGGLFTDKNVLLFSPHGQCAKAWFWRGKAKMDINDLDGSAKDLEEVGVRKHAYLKVTGKTQHGTKR